jgi:hypothetical protein
VILPSKENMEKELTKDGWNTLWHEDNWVAPDATNPDWEGMNIVRAFKVLLYKRYKKTGDTEYFSYFN